MTKRKHPGRWKLATVCESDINPDDFRDIPRTGGVYRINKNGMVLSARRPSLPDGYFVVLKSHSSKNSRPFNRVTIRYDGLERNSICQVSRLILEAWIGPPPTPKHVAAHRNGVPDDDRLDNLTWASMQEIKEASICRGTWAHGERAPSCRHKKEQIEAARKIVTSFNVPANLLATAMGVPYTRIAEWLNKTWDTDKWSKLENPLNPKGEADES